MRACLWIVALSGMMAWPALAAAPTTAPDLSSPKSAAMAFASALARGDAEMAKAASLGDARQLEIVDAIAQLVQARQQLDEAARAKFSDATAALKGDPAAAILARVREAQERVEGDTALLIRGADSQPFRLRRVEGQWKVDMPAMLATGDLARATPAYRTMTQAVRQTTEEIRAGKYKSFQDAQAALALKVRTAPATRPAER